MSDPITEYKKELAKIILDKLPFSLDLLKLIFDYAYWLETHTFHFSHYFDGFCAITRPVTVYISCAPNIINNNLIYGVYCQQHIKKQQEFECLSTFSIDSVDHLQAYYTAVKEELERSTKFFDKRRIQKSHVYSPKEDKLYDLQIDGVVRRYGVECYLSDESVTIPNYPNYKCCCLPRLWLFIQELREQIEEHGNDHKKYVFEKSAKVPCEFCNYSRR
jgi:hypothetical protein